MVLCGAKMSVAQEKPQIVTLLGNNFLHAIVTVEK